ncbi:MAG: BatD family protein [Planctomycetaceae bacterium]
MKITYQTLVLLSLTLCGMRTAFAGSVDIRLSAREAWVGMPVVLQLSINNASDYDMPDPPQIDGCDVRSAGTPSQSSQTTIINGRRTDSRSVVIQYLITPRREGTFDVPPITFKVDGRSVTTERQRFVATRSETGDLLFVEIEGNKKSVYVGQPLELTLKIWIKPFRDPERNITLSEANMWQMISDQTSWGSFSDRMQELADNNQRPGGQEVLRDDGQGSERSYCLYEIKATVYPKRPGKIDADDVQIVVNYPMKLGKSRDPFESFFGRSGFGSRSPLSQMMDDEFFSSPFSNRLTVLSSRPVVAEAGVDSTEVRPVPTEGRPADYRGAVGRYNLVTQATPTVVNAGDSITLNIGITGTGPMELVQAPPLHELSELTADFKVADESLAGFVQDDAKLFSTTIRPRREGITHIPAIPFSYFDPDTGRFETAMSHPIAITVNKSDSLSLDAIVANQRPSDSDGNPVSKVEHRIEPNFTNVSSADILVSQSPESASPWWLAFVVVPPIAWLATVLVRNRQQLGRRLPSFKSPKQRCHAAIDQATQPAQIVAALVGYIEGKTRRSCTNVNTAVGSLRTSGFAAVANEVEAFLQNCEHSVFNGSTSITIEECRNTAKQFLERMESEFRAMTRTQVRRSIRSNRRPAEVSRTADHSTYKVPTLLLAALLASTRSVAALESGSVSETNHLTAAQQRTILVEADDLYTQATVAAQTDSAEAADLFTASAAKYQLLVDSGIHNALLYRNLGNAYLRSDRLGRAIANYERAARIDPDDPQLAANRQFAKSLVKSDMAASDDTSTNEHSMSLAAIPGTLRTYNNTIINVIGKRVIAWLLAVSSLVFWGLHIVRATGRRFPAWKYSMAPLLLLVTTLMSVLLATTDPSHADSGIVITSQLTLHSGDGETFDTVKTLETAQGHQVRILTTRGPWTQIQTHSGHVGWVDSESLERLHDSIDG